MASYQKFEEFIFRLATKQHDLNADTLRIYLSNVAPVASNTVFGTPAEIATGNGYTASGQDVVNVCTENPAGTAEVTTASTITWTATTGSISAFRYVVAFNTDATTPANALVGWYDHGSTVNLAAGESFTVDFAANWLTLT
jgi:hypothetical protein